MDVLGVFSQNATLFFRNSPYYVDSELIVDSGVTLTIETGVQMYFATGVGLKIYGTIVAIVGIQFLVITVVFKGNEFAHIQVISLEYRA